MESSLSSARPENVAKTGMHPLGGRFGGVETGVGKLIFEGFKKKTKKRVEIRANCPFGGFKKTKESWNPVELSFWRLQKDKREL
ncbi:hypothetical protein [Heyndrickxia coagulans]|uniref:hypothetical protein n=1 Tax=Heyndrickxia coagulans TaxID=1398 RepID=UPI0022364D79|nr:hypothetical protein [Heyndrickxia coagulans]UZH05666.1 hypothetical protein ONG97_12285 [Heyndrickxia coagulans]